MEASRVKFLVNLDRKLAWILVLATLVMLFTGYALTRGFLDTWLMNRVHIYAQWIFMLLFLYHFIVTVFIIRFHWVDSIKKVLSGNGNTFLYLKLIQQSSGWILFVTGMLLFLSGLSWYGYDIVVRYLPFYRHLTVDFMFNIGLILHVTSSMKLAFIRRKITKSYLNNLVIFIGLVMLAFALLLEYII